MIRVIPFTLVQDQMLVWILGIIGFLVLLVLTAVLLSRRGTVYIHNPTGYVALTGPLQPLRRVTLGQLRGLIPFVISADRIDFLWVALRDDHYEGVALSEDDGIFTLGVGFGSNADQRKIETFTKQMVKDGYQLSDGNGRSGIEFVVPKDPELIYDLSLRALQALPEELEGHVYIEASLIREGVGRGIFYKPHKDLLSDLL